MRLPVADQANESISAPTRCFISVQFALPIPADASMRTTTSSGRVSSRPLAVIVMSATPPHAIASGALTVTATALPAGVPATRSVGALASGMGPVELSEQATIEVV